MCSRVGILCHQYKRQLKFSRAAVQTPGHDRWLLSDRSRTKTVCWLHPTKYGEVSRKQIGWRPSLITRASDIRSRPQLLPLDRRSGPAKNSKELAGLGTTCSLPWRKVIELTSSASGVFLLCLPRVSLLIR